MGGRDQVGGLHQTGQSNLKPGTLHTTHATMTDPVTNVTYYDLVSDNGLVVAIIVGIVSLAIYYMAFGLRKDRAAERKMSPLSTSRRHTAPSLLSLTPTLSWESQMTPIDSANANTKAVFAVANLLS